MSADCPGSTVHSDCLGLATGQHGEGNVIQWVSFIWHWDPKLTRALPKTKALPELRIEPGTLVPKPSMLSTRLSHHPSKLNEVNPASYGFFQW